MNEVYIGKERRTWGTCRLCSAFFISAKCNRGPQFYCSRKCATRMAFKRYVERHGLNWRTA